jgi:hypothetical protein
VKQSEIDGGRHRPLTSTDETLRIAELEREVGELRRVNGILQKVAGFSQPSPTADTTA